MALIQRRMTRFDLTLLRRFYHLASACQGLPMFPGDVSLHLGYTIHGTATNPSDNDREAIAIQYVPADTHLRRGLKQWLSAGMSHCVPSDYKGNPHLRQWVAADLARDGRLHSNHTQQFSFPSNATHERLVSGLWKRGLAYYHETRSERAHIPHGCP